jgi:16S rRNA (cytidine1402-2'-O)-methyltransferase
VRQALGDRPVVVARELTKLHEEYLRGSVGEVLAELKSRNAVKGEMTVLVGRSEKGASERAGVSDEPLAERVAALIAEGSPRMEAIKQAARERGISKREAYALLEADRDARGG